MKDYENLRIHALQNGNYVEKGHYCIEDSGIKTPETLACLHVNARKSVKINVKKIV